YLQDAQTEAVNIKSQAPSSRKAPGMKHQISRMHLWSLEAWILSFFGIWILKLGFSQASVNAKQLEQPVFQAGPNRCESDDGHQASAEFGVQSGEFAEL